MKFDVVAESVSPNGNVVAFVEQDDRCAYLYLRDADDDEPAGFGTKVCWVRNLRPAPAAISKEGMARGEPPMMPRGACAHPDGAAKFKEDGVRIVWFEEGDSAAVYEGDSMLAVIPSWGGEKGFAGYARDCTEMTQIAWPLEADNALHERVRAAEEYWASWDGGNPWAAVQSQGLSAVTKVFGEPKNYYAIDNDTFPPRAMLRCESADAVILITLGMQLQPQPRVERYAEDPRPLRRIELGLAIERSLFDTAGEQLMRWISGQARHPWARYTWLGNFHTFSCNAVPVGASGQPYQAMLLQRQPFAAPQIDFQPFRGDPVNLLWLVPISDSERELAKSTGGAALSKLLTDAGHGFIHRDRKPVA